jgi:chitinase
VTQAEVTPSADPILTITDATVVESNTSFSPNMQFAVNLSQAAATDVTVAYQTIRGTATEEFDFNQTVGTLTIVAGQTSGTITITTFGDVAIEADEYFVVELTNAQGAAFADGALRARAIGIMQDNDGAGNKLGLFVDDAQIVEGAAGTKEAIFRVKLSRDPASVLTLNYTTVNGSATAGQDYTATSGTLTFNPGETVKAVAVPILGDLTIESSETFSLVVTPTAAIGNGAAGAAGIATIMDDDAGGGTVPVLSLADAEVLESNTSFSPNLEFVVTLSQAAATDVVVAYQTIGGTATEEFDFDQTVGTLTILAGQTSGRITITAFGDTAVEPDEYLSLELTNAQGAVFAGGGRSLRATGVMLDDDRGDTRPSLFVEDAQVVEGVAGSQRLLTFNVHLSQPTTDTVTVAYTTAPGTASSVSDYTPKQGTLTFAPGQTVAAVQISILGDNTTEASERFSLILSAPQGTPMASGGAGLAGTAMILDDDAGGGAVPVVSITDVEVLESNTSFSPSMEFVLTLSAPTTAPVTVQYVTVNGTATAGQDYTAVTTPTTVTFQPGQTSAQVTITILGGTVVEPDETLFLQLSNPVNAVLAGGVTTLQGIGTIRDNDSPAPVPGLPVVTVQDLVVQEQVGGSTATFTLSIPTPAGLNITGTYAILAGTASANADYTPNTGTFTILAGATSTTVSVPVLNDNLVEPIETFVLKLTLPQNAQFANASPALYAITRIVDNDFVLDVDGNGVADALTDGIVIIRHLFGFTGDALINGAVDPLGARNTAQLVEEFLTQISDRLDVDGNGQADALTDGIAIIRFLFGFRGDALINGVVDTINGTRTTAAEIEAFLQGFLPGSTAAVAEPVETTTTASSVATTPSSNLTVEDSGVYSADLSLAYVQKSWVEEFITDGAGQAEEDEEELLIALPG